MKKRYDDSSGAIIFTHSEEERAQAKAVKNAKKTEKKVQALCKILNVSPEDLEAAMNSVESES